MPQFIIASSDIDQGKIVLKGNTYKHLKSLRISSHEIVILLDENGNRYNARLEGTREHKAVFRILDQISMGKKQSGIILAQAVIKNEKMHIVLQKATELGVDVIVPFISKYTIVKIKGENFINRCDRIIREAVSQSMRRNIPKIYNQITYKELITSMSDVHKILFHYGHGVQPLYRFTDIIKQSERIMLIVGPEGGFSEDEIRYANDHMVTVAGLGDNVLRAETAAISAISIASFIREQ